MRQVREVPCTIYSISSLIFYILTKYCSVSKVSIM